MSELKTQLPKLVGTNKQVAWAVDICVSLIIKAQAKK